MDHGIVLDVEQWVFLRGVECVFELCFQRMQRRQHGGLGDSVDPKAIRILYASERAGGPARPLQPAASAGDPRWCRRRAPPTPSPPPTTALRDCRRALES